MGKIWVWLSKNKDILVRAGELIVAVGVAIKDSLKADEKPKA
jgi:hypothetical protein